MSQFVSADGLVLDYDFVVDAYVPQTHVVNFFDAADASVGIFENLGECMCGRQFNNMNDLWNHVDSYDIVG